MTGFRSPVPPVGNPMRPDFIFIGIFFAGILIGFPVYVYATGGPVERTIGILIMLGVVGLISLAIIAVSADHVEQERQHFRANEAWAVWHISEEEYRQFVLAEIRSSVPSALLTVAIPFALLAIAWWTTRTPWIGVFAVVFPLLLFPILLLTGSPPLHAVKGSREIRIGPDGIEAMGRYIQIQGSRRILRGIRLLPTDPPVLLFLVSVKRNQPYQVRIPVPADRIEEARAVVHRFDPPPPANETYPELLRRKRSANQAAGQEAST